MQALKIERIERASPHTSWRDALHGVVSLYDMLRFAADDFHYISATLTNLINYSAQLRTADGWGECTDSLQLLYGHAKKLGMPLSCNQAIATMDLILGQKTPLSEIRAMLHELQKRVQEELQAKMFFCVPSERAARYDIEEAFGSAVHKNFPSSSFDIKEAGNSYACGRSTACVFHLMRALEIALSAFAGLFHVPSDHTNWHNIIEGIESKIRDMGKDPNKVSDWKEKQEKYAQAANGFMFFKDAWRNYTAHARGKYTEDEADGIYRNVSSFMQKLAQLGLSE